MYGPKPRTLENYHYLITTHITPRFGHIPLGQLRASNITSWSADLHTAGYQHSTIVGIVSL